MRARIYAEGGGEGQLLDTLFRQGWSAFFRSAGLEGRMPSVIRCGSRESAFDDFRTAVRNPRPGVLPLLLVDSEAAVDPRQSAWEHLKALDGWDRPQGVADDQAFLMVQVMETWFFADRDLLRRFFGSALREKHLRAWPDLEAVPKATVLAALEAATAACGPRYAKGRISFDLLAGLDARVVEGACPHAAELLDRLRKV